MISNNNEWWNKTNISADNLKLDNMFPVVYFLKNQPREFSFKEELAINWFRKLVF